MEQSFQSKLRFYQKKFLTKSWNVGWVLDFNTNLCKMVDQLAIWFGTVNPTQDKKIKYWNRCEIQQFFGNFSSKCQKNASLVALSRPRFLLLLECMHDSVESRSILILKYGWLGLVQYFWLHIWSETSMTSSIIGN